MPAEIECIKGYGKVVFHDDGTCPIGEKKYCSKCEVKEKEKPNYFPTE